MKRTTYIIIAAVILAFAGSALGVWLVAKEGQVATTPVEKHVEPFNRVEIDHVYEFPFDVRFSICADSMSRPYVKVPAYARDYVVIEQNDSTLRVRLVDGDLVLNKKLPASADIIISVGPDPGRLSIDSPTDERFDIDPALPDSSVTFNGRPLN